MADHAVSDLTELLHSVSGGREGAFNELVDAVYNDLRRIAAGKMADRFDRPLAGLTIQPTAIANDAVMELRRQRAEWNNSDQFFAIATRLILRLVLQYQRARLAEKRGAGQRGARLDEPMMGLAAGSGGDAAAGSEILSALESLHASHPRQAEVVTLHVIRGMPLPAVAAAIDMSLPTVERDWRFGKAWLRAGSAPR